MTRRPDEPCVVCGELRWWRNQGRPRGGLICHGCRRRRRGYVVPPPRQLQMIVCPVCGLLLAQGRPDRIYCDRLCRERKRTQGFVRVEGCLRPADPSGRFPEGPPRLQLLRAYAADTDVWVCPWCWDDLPALTGGGESWCGACRLKVTAHG